jgi:hypothetical protein
MNIDPLEAAVQEELKSQAPQGSVEDPLGDLGGDIVTPEQLSYRQEQEKYQTLPMAGAAALAGAARGLTFGASDVLLRGAGLAEPARKLQAYLPEASLTGEVLGGIGGAFLGPGALVAKGAAAATAGIARPVLRAGAREALEGALYGVGQTVSDQALGTPESVAESLIANVGLGSIIGGTFGMGMHGVAEGAQALKGQVSKLLKGDNVVSRFMGEADDFVLDEFKKTAPNIEEIKRLAQQEGIPLTKGMLSDSEIIRGLESSLAQKPTMFGQLVRQEVEPTYRAFQKQAAKVVEEASEDTVESIADNVKNELVSRAHQLYDPASSLYQKINQEFDAITLTPDMREKLVKQINDWAGQQLKTSPARKAALDSIENLSDMIDMPLSKVKAISSDLGQRAQNLRQTGFSNEGRLVNILKDKVDNYLERQVKRAAIDQALQMPNGQALAKELLADLKEAKKGWREFKGFLEDIGEEAGLGKIKSFEQFIDRVESIDNAKLARNLFDVKSPKTLRFLKESFPDIFEQYRRIEIAKLAAKTQGFDKMGNSVSDVLKLKKELDKYAPESAQLILGKDKIRTINNLHELYRKIPRKIGPSGTPEGMWYTDVLKPALWAADFANYGIYKAGQIATDVQSKQTKEITNRFKNFITGAKKTVVPASTIAVTSSFKDYQKNLDYVQQMATNPDQYAAKIDESTKGLAQIDPSLQQAIANTSMEAVSFLQSKAPKNPFADSMFKSKVQWKPSDAELSKFNRYLKAIDDPFSILTDLEQGVLTSEGVEAVKTIYSDLYNKFVTEAVKQVGEHEQDIPFSKQLQLSLLLGQPLTNAQDTQMMQRLQQGAQASGAQEEAQAQGGMRPKSKKIDGDFLKGQMSQSEQLQRSRGQ